MSRLTPLQKKFLEMTPVGVWLRPSDKGFEKHGIKWRTLKSLRTKGYITTAREIGGQLDEWAFRIKRLK